MYFAILWPRIESGHIGELYLSKNKLQSEGDTKTPMPVARKGIAILEAGNMRKAFSKNKRTN
jgi:hypothetical protein